MTHEELNKLEIFSKYTQKELAKLWGYKSYDAIRRGVVTPSGEDIIILFLTLGKGSETDANTNRIEGSELYMCGEEKHGHDKRINDNLTTPKDKIYLFMRDSDHSQYVYYGEITLIDSTINDTIPSLFKFEVPSIKNLKQELDFFVVRTNFKDNIDHVQNGDEEFVLDGLNTHIDIVKSGMPLLFVFGGNMDPWPLGLAAICQITTDPMDEGYDPDKKNNYKLGIKIIAKLEQVMTKSDFIPYRDSYDTFIGPQTKGSMNQSLLRINEDQVVSILRGILDMHPQLESHIESLYPKEVVERIKSPMTLYVPTIKDYGDPIVPNISDKKSSNGTIGDNIILYGVPGAGKSHTIETEYCNDDEHMERVVFHPDYTYSDFVGQIMPKIKEGTDKLEYRFVAGPFTKIMKKAYDNPSESFYLVIEEINRGNAPAIFGDVFQLLDRNDDGTSTYGITNQDIADAVYAAVGPDKKVKIPANLTIIATMNTADQSVFTLDTAFKRRWNMRMIPNDVENCKFANVKILGTDVTWETFVTVINDLILSENSDLTSTEDKRIGAYFVKRKDIELIDGKYNPAFAEKVLMYLWNDVFKFSRDTVFNEKYNSLDKLIKGFEAERFNVFNLEEFKIAAEGNESDES